MNTPQLYGQRLRPAQETGNEKVLSLLSIHQTLIDHFKDVMIDSSGLVMDHRNSPVGFMEDIFTRLTQRLVFEFLGGHVKMEELLCLGDLADGNDEFHPTTPIPMEAYSESSRSTDNIVSIPKSSMNANLICNKSVMNILNLDHPTPSMPFQHSDFTGNFVMSTIAFGLSTDSLDSNSAPDTLFKTLAFKLQKINVNRTKEIQEVALTNHHHALTSGNLESQFHRQHKNLNDVPVSNPCSTPAWNNETINDGNTFSIPNPGKLMDYLYGDLENPQFLDTESSSMKSEDLCCTIGNIGEGPTFSVPDPSKLMNFLYGDLEFPVFLSFESIEEEVPIYIEYDGNDSKVEVISRSVDHTIEESYQCSGMPSLAVLEKIAGLMTESLRDSNGFTNGMDFMLVKIPSSTRFDKESSKISDSKLSYHQDEFKIADYFNFTSKVHNTPATEPNSPISKNLTTFVPTTSPLFYKSEEDEENMTTDLLPFASSTDKPSLMDKNSTRSSYENPEIYASSPCCDQKGSLLGDYGSDDDVEVADLSDCMYSWLFDDGFNYNTLNLPIESKNGSLAGAFGENEITPTSSVSVGCDGERISLDSSFSDFSDHDDLLEFYGLSNQEQYTDTSYSCASPTWTGKMEGQIQKSLTRLMSNKTKDDNANGTLTTDFSLFHSNTDETSVMNKKSTDDIYEENSENSVSQCCLNHMNCDLETSLIDAGRMDCLPLLHLCNDGFGDSIEHQSLGNDGNELKFAFSNPSTLKEYFFGSLDSPQFLASELLVGQIDNLHYPSLLGDCEQNDRTEESDLSGKMILDQLCEDFSKDDNSINKLPCSAELLGLIPSSFDISDQDELLEWYGINDQDQFMGDDWTCNSPTWPGKIKA